MKRIAQVALSLLLAVAIFLPGTAVAFADSGTKAESQPVVLADSDDAIEVTSYPLRSLVIRAPEKAEVGQPVTIKVLTRQNYQPVAGAAVYALKTTATITSADQNDYTTTANKYASLAKAQGIYLGSTNDDGTVRYPFKDTGRYILVAIKDGFVPGFAFITITLSAEKGLIIKAPSSAEVNTTVTILVLERNSYEPVAKAAVYAKKTGEIITPEVSSTSSSGTTEVKIAQVKPSVISNKQIITASPAIAVDDAQQAEEIRQSGFFIGYTNEKGEVEHRFEDTGRYIMAAIKEDYSPGFARISIILANQKALGIKAPGQAKVGEPVTFMVIERRTGEPVPKANVYALRIRTIEPVESEPVYAPEDVTVAITDEYISEVREKGIFIGTTNKNGEVGHKFEDTGLFMVVAFKDGYIPAIHGISITLANERVLAIKVPDQAGVGEEVTVTVFERTTSTLVEGAAVYALQIINADITAATGSVPGPVSVPVVEQAAAETSTKPVVSAMSEPELLEERFLIGYTDERGRVVHEFSNTGTYQLVATKPGYARGTSRITITLSNQKDLVIRAPQEAKVNERVRIEVREDATHQFVPDADVFALRVDTIEEAISLILKAADGNLARVVEGNGTHLGSTDEYGILVTGFSRTGYYILMADKAGYAPDFTAIQINADNVTFPWRIKLFQPDSDDSGN